jgi:hypothetical protein
VWRRSALIEPSHHYDFAMPDVAQALLIPSSDGLLDLGAVLSAMLIWDRVLIPQTALVGPTTPAGTRSLAPYVDAGAAVWLDPVGPTEIKQSVESAIDFVRGFEDDFPPDSTSRQRSS